MSTPTTTEALPLTNGSALTFAEHKEITAKDCEQVAAIITDLAAKVREGDMKAFEAFWIADGTEEGDSRIAALREVTILRYFHREEQMQNDQGQVSRPNQEDNTK